MSAHARPPRPRRTATATTTTTTHGSHGTVKGYVTGFVLSVILTAIPFWLVMGKVFDEPSTTAPRDPGASRPCRSSCT